MHYLLAMAGQSGGEGGGSSLLGAMLPFLLILLVLYFLMLRPQMKKQKQHQSMLKELKKGDRIVTSGGMYATILKVSDNDNKVVLKVADDIKMEFLKSSIAQKVS
ncbi:MAG: preprotein translocase subunit YajC [candidate division Zixibacteria bacterium]|nr:preprotein translocase subunit YajC [candidate division Zixibacteria bacterium]